MTLITRRTTLFTMAAAAGTLAAPALVRAANSHEIQMLSKHPEDKKLRNVFLPRVLAVDAGDTVTWMPADKGHNSAASKGMIPDGVEAWNGKISKEVAVTFDKPGIYGYQCTPHLSLGMVGLVVVKGDGMMDNLDAAKGVKQRGKAKKVWGEIWAELDEMNLTA